jgi:hypothetical protein
MAIKVDKEWLREMVERQGDTPEPAPYVTYGDLEILAQRRAERIARQQVNGNGSHTTKGDEKSVFTASETVDRVVKKSP